MYRPARHGRVFGAVLGAAIGVAVGRDDRSTPVAEAQALHAAISGSQLDVIEHAAHLPNIEQASRFNAVLDRFLDAHAIA